MFLLESLRLLGPKCANKMNMRGRQSNHNPHEILAKESESIKYVSYWTPTKKEQARNQMIVDGTAPIFRVPQTTAI